MVEDFNQSDMEWREKLSPEEYAVLRGKGTETPGSGKYLHETRQGTYACKACGNPLFPSDAKYSSTEPGLMGWPSFDQALPGAVTFEHDPSYGMNRTEVVCARCGSHLGHIFDDAEAKTGKHYCINSVCLNLQAKEEKK
jgi:peptide-methionine (R)-S-oxide reductase